MVEVAPREITDAVYYCCRVVGIDPGTAHLIADNVTAAEIAGGRAVAEFVSGLTSVDPEPMAELLSRWAVDDLDVGVDAEQFEQRRSQVMGSGLHISAEAMAVLKSVSSRFLVSESAVDAAVADAAVVTAVADGAVVEHEGTT